MENLGNLPPNLRRSWVLHLTSHILSWAIFDLSRIPKQLTFPLNCLFRAQVFNYSDLFYFL